MLVEIHCLRGASTCGGHACCKRLSGELHQRNPAHRLSSFLPAVALRTTHAVALSLFVRSGQQFAQNKSFISCCLPFFQPTVTLTARWLRKPSKASKDVSSATTASTASCHSTRIQTSSFREDLHVCLAAKNVCGHTPVVSISLSSAPLVFSISPLHDHRGMGPMPH